MASNKISIYSYRRCPFAIRVRIALHEKEIPFETKEEDLKNFSTELKALHPEVKVPLLVHGNRVIYESAIITEYIEDLLPNKNSLMPNDAGLRSEVRLWTYWCNQQFKPALDPFKYGTSRFPENECQGSREKVIKCLIKIEEQLQKQTWLVGSSFSLADINVFPFIRQLIRIQPAPEFLNSFPRLMNWIQTISNRPSVIKALQK